MATITNYVRWADNTKELQKNLSDGLNQIEATRAGVDKLLASFQGDKLVQAAHKWVAAIQEVGGVTKLSASEQERATTIIDKAIGTYERYGKSVPDAFRQTAASLHEVTEAGKGMLGWMDDLGHSFIARVAEGVLLRDAIRGIFSFGKEAFADAAKFEDLARATGLSLETIQRFNYVAPAFGVTLEELARGVEQLSGKLASGDASAVKSVQALGLSVTDLLAKGPKEAFLEVTESAARVEDPMQKAAVASGLFGERLSKTLLPALGELRTKLNEVPEGAIISDDDVKNAKNLETALSHAFTWAESLVVKLAMLPKRIGFGAADFSGGTGPIPTSAGPVSLEEQNGFNQGLIQTGKDIELVSAASQKLLTQTDLINNRLKALKEDALSPLSAAQKAQIDELKAWGENEDDIAKLVQTTTIAVHRYIEAHRLAQEELKKSEEAQRKFDDAIHEASQVGASYVDTLHTMDGVTVAFAEHFLDQGLSAEKVKLIFGLTDIQVKALTEDLKFQKAVVDDTAKAFRALIVTLPDLSDGANIFKGLTREGLLPADDTLEKFNKHLIELKDIARPTSGVMEAFNEDLADTAEKAKKAREELAKTFSADIASSILHAFEGGGNVAQSIGALFGGDLGKKAALSFGTSFGGMIAGGLVTGGLSIIGGELGNIIAGIGQPSAAELQTRQQRDQFMGSFGGTNAKGIQGIADALTQAGVSAEGAQIRIARMLDAKTPAQFAIALKGVTDILDGQKAAQNALNDALSRYHFTIEELGPALEKQNLDEQAKQLYQDWQVLTKAGVGVAAVGAQMSGNISQFVQDTKKAGGEIPIAMKPMLQQMIDMGDLVDENGNKITDLGSSGITFSETMTQGFQDVVGAVDKLTSAIQNMLGIVHTIPDNPFAGWTSPDLGFFKDLRSITDFANGNQPPSFPTEAYVRYPTLAMVGDVSGGEFVLKPSTINRWMGASVAAGVAMAKPDAGGAVTNHFSIQAIDAQSFQQALRRHKGADVMVEDIGRRTRGLDVKLARALAGKV